MEKVFEKIKVFNFFQKLIRNHKKPFGLQINLVAGILKFERKFQFRRKSILQFIYKVYKDFFSGRNFQSSKNASKDAKGLLP